MKVTSSAACLLLMLSFFSPGCERPKPGSVSTRTKPAVEPARSTTYIGELRYFPETGEFSTPVFLYPDFEESETEALAKQLDSIVFKDEGFKRSRLPLALAKSRFMLADMDTVFIYATDHKLVTKAALRRVELIEEGKDRRFVGVFKGSPLQGEPAEQYYCTNRLMSDLRVENFSHSILNNPSLDEFLLHKVHERSPSNWTVTNLELRPSGSILSVMSSPERSLIAEYRESEFRVLVEMTRDYKIEQVLPLAIEVNEKPLLLATLYNARTKQRSTSLAVFMNYQEYKIINYNRLRQK